MNYKIGTRGSKLAMYQAQKVQALLTAACPEDTFELQIITTEGDTVTDRPLDKIGGSGVFVKEIEKQILSGEIQLAVHSMKDLPRRQPKGLILMPVGEYEDPRDVLVLREKGSLAELPPGAVIATGSSRRKYQLLALRPDLTIVGIRGNVETRIRKMHEQQLDGIVLAAAGMKRLGLEEQITQYFEPEEMVPAPTQGILAVELRADDSELNDKIKRVLFFKKDQTHMVFLRAEAERLFLQKMAADCHQPIGAWLTKEEDHYLFYAFYGEAGTGRMVRVLCEGMGEGLNAKELSIRKANDFYHVKCSSRDPMQLVRTAIIVIFRKIGGKVLLVGAGSGDPGLITVKGKEALSRADCILYDRLIPRELLRLAPAGCELIYVGKEDSNHTLPQEQINELLLKKAIQYHCVVRLKGGDPYVFGRGGEEALYLSERGICCEVIPGVTAAMAALAYAGIPVTHRGLAEGFRAVTAHARDNQEARIDYAGMAAGTDTCIFYMGLSELPEITRSLIEAGKSADTPAAVISHGTIADQHTCVGTLSDIAARTAKAELTSPAIIVVGDVVRLHNRLNFFEQQPLFGKKYLVAEVESLIRKTEGTLSEQLKSQGAWADRVITGYIKRIAVTLTEGDLCACDWILFTSKNGVIAFFENLWENNLDARCFGRVKIACIGTSTAAVLEDYHIRADYISKGKNGQAFGNEMAEIFATDSKDGEIRVLYPQNRSERHPLTETLTGTCKLTELPVYENVLPDSGPVFRDGKISFAGEMNPAGCTVSDEDLLTYDGICFTNASGVKRFLGSRPAELLQKLSERGLLYAIGPETADALKSIGCISVHIASEPSYEGMLNCMGIQDEY